jgi:hypothetical protein
MKLKTKSFLGILISFLVVIIVLGSFSVLIYQDVNKELLQNKISVEILQGVFDLNILANDYLRHPEERAYAQWETKFDSTSKLFKLEGIEEIEAVELMDSLTREYNALDDFFIEIVKLHEPDALTEESSSSELRDILISQMSTKSEVVVFLASRLSEDINDHLTSTLPRKAC